LTSDTSAIFRITNDLVEHELNKLTGAGASFIVGGQQYVPSDLQATYFSTKV
jgi:hypothetical protein